IANDTNVELLQPGLEYLQFGLSLFERGIEAGLIPAVERREVDHFERGIQLLLALDLSLFVGCDDWAGRKEFHSQKSGVGTRVPGLDRNFAVKESCLHVVSSQPTKRERSSASSN